VAGGIVGRKMAEYALSAEVIFKSTVIDGEARAQEERIQALISGKNGSQSVYKVRAAMQEALNKGANIFRNAADLEACVATLQDVLGRAREVGLKSSGLGASPELAAALKIEGQVKMALMVAHGALQRTESRGSHNREDFPARNDRDWLVRTLATWKSPEDTLPTLAYEPATQVFEIPPGDRGYGKTDVISAESKKE